MISSSDLKRVEKTVARARRNIVLRHPFFAQFFLGMSVSSDTDTPTAVASVSGIRYNPEFFLKAGLTELEIQFVLTHEAAHLFLGHPRRAYVLGNAYARVYREQFGEEESWPGVFRDLYQKAADYVVNLFLKEYYAGISSDRVPVVPEGALIDEAYAGKYFEEVFDILFRELNQDSDETSEGGSGGGSGGGAGAAGGAAGSSGNSGDGSWAKTPDYGLFEEASEEVLAKETIDWEAQLAGAARVALARGDFPAGAARLIFGAAKPRVSWRSKLLKFVRDTRETKYDWMSRDRRYAESDVIVPGTVPDPRISMVFAVDTSGSVSNATLDRFLAEVAKALNDVKWETIDILYVDAKVEAERFRKGSRVVFRPKGGGGTDFRPVFEWVRRERRKKPDCLVYFTDGFGLFPDDPPGYPVLWLDSGEGAKYPSWAKVVKIPRCEL